MFFKWNTIFFVLLYKLLYFFLYEMPINKRTLSYFQKCDFFTYSKENDFGLQKFNWSSVTNPNEKLAKEVGRIVYELVLQSL